MTCTKPVLIIQTGRAPTPIRGRHGDFPDWFRVSTKLPKHRVRVIHVAGGEDLPAPEDVAGALITGSAAMVTDRAAWSEHTAGWIRQAMDSNLPLFGVCYGHQLMAHALGGRVGYLPGGREIGTHQINLTNQPATDHATAGLPSQFRAHTTHEQTVLETPAPATVLAYSARDPHHMLRYGPHAISTQFHPEFNADIMRAYIQRKKADLMREGNDPAITYRTVSATPSARRILADFVRQHAWLESKT